MMKPLSALYNSINKQVSIICKDGTECRGKIVEVDEFMNIVLRDPQESKNGKSEKIEGMLLVRGSDMSIIRLEENQI